MLYPTALRLYLINSIISMIFGSMRGCGSSILFVCLNTLSDAADDAGIRTRPELQSGTGSGGI